MRHNNLTRKDKRTAARLFLAVWTLSFLAAFAVGFTVRIWS